MRNLDYSPLYRSTVGFDRLFNLLDNVSSVESTNANSYPPYNIERTGENTYRISMAVAGFRENEISIESKQNSLTISAAKNESETDKDREFLFRGIAARSFERRFQLADYVEVTGANLENGLLHVELVREIPEAMKPRKIEISGTKASTAKNSKQIEGKAEAKAA